MTACGGAKLKTLPPVLHDVADADHPKELARVDDPQVADPARGHQRPSDGRWCPTPSK
jgi:hypothetical protein